MDADFSPASAVCQRLKEQEMYGGSILILTWLIFKEIDEMVWDLFLWQKIHSHLTSFQIDGRDGGSTLQDIS